MTMTMTMTMTMIFWSNKFDQHINCDNDDDCNVDDGEADPVDLALVEPLSGGNDRVNLFQCECDADGGGGADDDGDYMFFCDKSDKRAGYLNNTLE